MKREPIYIGFDIAKGRVDVAVRPTGQGWSISYEDGEVEELVGKLRGLEPAAVILEATGWPGTHISGVPGCGITAKCVISPSPPANRPRPTDLMPKSWLTLERLSIRPCAGYVMLTPRCSERCWPAGVR